MNTDTPDDRDARVATVLRKLKGASSHPWSNDRIEAWLDTFDAHCPDTDSLVQAADRLIETWDVAAPFPIGRLIDLYRGFHKSNLLRTQGEPPAEELPTLEQNRRNIAELRKAARRGQ